MDNRLFVLFIFALIIIFLCLERSSQAPLRSIRRNTGNAAEGYIYSTGLMVINNQGFLFQYFITDRGALTTEVAANFGPQGLDDLICYDNHANFDPTFHTVREIGPSSRVFEAYSNNLISEYVVQKSTVPANSIGSCKSLIYGGPSQNSTSTNPACSSKLTSGYGAGFHDDPTDPDYSYTTDTKYICYMNDILSKSVLLSYSTHFSTMQILATTSEHEDHRKWNLIVTHMGFGLLAQVRGSVITTESFISGYTPLFDDIDTPDCGQRTTSGYDPLNPNKLITNFTNPNPIYKKICGASCSIVQPYSALFGIPVIWEMASPNGRYRLQFYDSGNVAFIDRSSLVPIYSTIANAYPNKATADFPLCTINEPNAEAPGVGLEQVRDAWLIKHATYDVVLSDANHFVASNVDLMVQITNYGQMVLMKNYIYGLLRTDTSQHVGVAGLWPLTSGGEPVDTDHIVVQSTLPKNGSPANSTLMFATVQSENILSPLNRTDGIAVGSPAINDSLNYQQHYSLGNVLVCQGVHEMAQYDWDNGTTLAISDEFQNQKYFLWLGPFGLRLLRLSTSVNGTPIIPEPTVQPSDLIDFSGGSLLSKWGCQWITEPYYEWFYHHDTATNPSRLNAISAYSTCPLAPNPPSCSLAVCGTFATPIAKSSDRVVLTLRSPNKRYCFYMLSSGVCRLVDGSNVLFTTESYSTCTGSEPQNC